MLFGIDTSHWQGDFDFVSAKTNENIDFAIIKCGGADDGLYKDVEFENSYKKLTEAGIHEGAYFFGNAFSEDEAKNEARYCASLLTGKSFCYPIFYDVEGSMLTGEDLTNIVLAFMNELKEAGFVNVGLYMSESHMNNYIDIQRVKDSGFYLWVARYSDIEPNLNGIDYDIWQFGGGVNYLRDKQINGQTVDQNYCYTVFCENHIVETPNIPDYEPVVDTRYHKGNKVVVINAIQYDNGQPFTVYFDEYDVISVSGSRVVIGIDNIITAAISEDNIRMADSNENVEINTDITAHANTNCKVRVLDNITYDGQRFAVYYDEYDVIESNGDRLVIGIGDIVTCAINANNVEFVGGDSVLESNNETVVNEVYTVVEGDTLSDIASRYGTTVDNLVEINGIENANLIYPGQEITIG